ncbi:hypothetical protein SAMN06295955_101868 [Sphingopyxis indica]|uniref:WYL domain-containing protein n=2 Tax=Sphingopyxis indica TaxID=436663 RepID=A0A239EQ19_9SPHN|nr:hypothetical protein SAMN06295955_101868 [Sphingopyxis indica]
MGSAPCDSAFAVHYAAMHNDTRMTLLQAIATRHMVAADYNGARLTLAPHLMFERHGDLFVSAHNPAKAIRSDEEPRLGHFKLEGLRAVELLEAGFDPLPGFAPVPPKADDTLILAV